MITEIVFLILGLAIGYWWRKENEENSRLDKWFELREKHKQGEK